jgi:protein-S-isoprenylcysteine O-methyltransferase Ste14
MHGQTETSSAPRTTWVVLHLAELLVALWLLLGGGYATLGSVIGHTWSAGDPARRVVLAVFCVVLWARMSLTGLYLLRRRFGWSEAVPVTLASGLYQWGFALLGAGSTRPLGVLDLVGIAAFIAGSVFNTGSELQRLAFKRDPAHKGRLYTGGFFALCRHPNYFGDSLWGVGWALVTASPWSFVIVLLEVSGFVFSQIPALDRYLEEHYGDDYRAWARRTKRLVPFVY